MTSLVYIRFNWNILNKEKQNFPIWWEFIKNEVGLVDATLKSRMNV